MKDPENMTEVLSQELISISIEIQEGNDRDWHLVTMAYLEGRYDAIERLIKINEPATPLSIRSIISSPPF